MKEKQFELLGNLRLIRRKTVTSFPSSAGPVSTFSVGGNH